MMSFSTSYAASLESLVMPGPLARAHAEYEAECSHCHKPFSKQQQDELCLDCHEEQADDIRLSSGHHGRNPAVENQACKNCHTDHKGRDADIVRLDRDTFAHTQTDFALKGAHKTIPCEACHAEGKAFHEAPGRCIDCHRDDDLHQSAMGDACQDCHQQDRWADAPFEHDKTDYPLTGKHTQAACNSCHPNQKYQDTPNDCISCHAWNDRHRGQFGTQCNDCHSTRDWDRVRFDHTKDTGFALTGKHDALDCTACHRGHLYQDKPGTSCHDCHRLSDPHQGRNGKRCDDCHTSQTWEALQFNHDRDTDFILKGRHADLACNTCHRGALHQETLAQQCIGCHRQDDVHAGQQGEQCQRCHQETAWGRDVRFDHDLSRFPLIGTHAVVSCEDCHTTQAYQDTASQCVDCHENRDLHQGVFGQRCDRCHNPNAWLAWRFDHDTGTDFALNGAHAGLDCHACHRVDPAAAKGPVSGHTPASSCVACHQNDDTHNGQFGRFCERCHDTESFNDATFQ